MRVLVIGGAGVDYKAYAAAPLAAGVSAVGAVRMGFGGVGRNIAENLARLGLEVTLLTALGDDLPGEQLRGYCETLGIDMQHVRVLSQHRTGSYSATFDPSGELFASISDFAILDAGLSTDYLASQEAQFAAADLLVLDANAPTDTLTLIFALAARYRLRVLVDPTLTPKASRLVPFLNGCSAITPSMAEASAMCGASIATPADAEWAARWLVEQGAGWAIITLGAEGILAAGATNIYRLPALPVQVVDVTGAGDALTAGIAYGMLHQCSPEETLRLGLELAALTLQISESVSPHLSPSLLNL